MCENVARYDCTRNFEDCGHDQISFLHSQDPEPTSALQGTNW
jgi:hypothetical protein